EHASHHRGEEHPEDAALVLPLLDRVDVGDARPIRRETGVLDAVVRDDGDSGGARRVLVPLDVGAGSGPVGLCHGFPFLCFRAHGRFDVPVSQTVIATMPPRAKIQTHSPSDTGPRLPSSMPPGAVVFSMYLRYEMIAALSSGVMFASLKTGMFCGPTIMAS